MVVAIAIALLSLLSTVGSAQTEAKSSPPLPPAVAQCHIHGGTTVIVKANEILRDVNIGGYCNHAYVPKGWSVICRVDRELKNVDLSYSVEGDERRTLLTCS